MNSPLRKARKASKLTLDEVATAVGTDTGNLSRIERGKQDASKEMVDKLVRFFEDKLPEDMTLTELEIIYPERYATAGDDDGNQANSEE